MTAYAEHEREVLQRGFQKSPFTHHGATRDVYRRGQGPRIIVLSEMPGITPPTLALCDRLNAAGYAVVMPQLIGRPGRPLSLGAFADAFTQVCVSREFSALAKRQASPIAEWLRALARHEHDEHGGRGVGVIGMCLTGGFGLAMMVEPAVMAPVLSQPSLPFSVTKDHACALGISDEDLARVKQRLKQEDLKVLGLRFTHDTLSPAARFRTLEQELGDRFIAVEIQSGLGNAHGIKPWAHSVLTNDYVDRKTHPTYAAFEQVLGLFARQLGPSAQQVEQSA